MSIIIERINKEVKVKCKSKKEKGAADLKDNRQHNADSIEGILLDKVPSQCAEKDK